MSDRPPNFYTIPMGAKPVKCRSCPTFIYFVRTHRGKLIPIEVRDTIEGSRRPGPLHDGKGEPHHAFCPAAQTWRHEHRASAADRTRHRKDVDE